MEIKELNKVKENNKMALTTEDSLLWVETEYGFYTIEDGQLIFAYDVNDIHNDDCLVQVSDLTDLTTVEYNELGTLLNDNVDYVLEGKFI
jgi:hypothetical protein